MTRVPDVWIGFFHERSFYNPNSSCYSISSPNHQSVSCSHHDMAETITHLSDTRMYFFFFMEGNSNKNKMNNLRVFLYDIDSKIIIQRNQNFVYWWTWQQHEKHLITYGRIYNYKPYLKIRIWELNICSMPCHKSFMTETE